MIKLPSNFFEDNKYCKKTDVSQAKFWQIIYYFAHEYIASQKTKKAAVYTKISRNAINYILGKIRIKNSEFRWNNQDQRIYIKFCCKIFAQKSPINLMQTYKF